MMMMMMMIMDNERHSIALESTFAVVVSRFFCMLRFLSLTAWQTENREIATKDDPKSKWSRSCIKIHYIYINIYILCYRLSAIWCSALVHFLLRYKQNGEQLYIPPDQLNEPNPISISYFGRFQLLFSSMVVEVGALLVVVGNTRNSSFIPFHKDNLPWWFW